MAKTKGPKKFGLLAEYDTPGAIFKACEKVRDAGYRRWDSFTPFPVHNLDKAMGIKPSVLPWIVFACGMTGAACGMLLQWYTSTIVYPIVIAGKPLFSAQANVPVTFEVGILFASFGAVFGMLGLNKLPAFHHPLFKVPRFSRATDDRFFIAIEAIDPRYDLEKTKKLLEDTGAVKVEEVEE
ncbi:hypothetical protein PPSIR1_01132 [Plesiocystis pacifica SIR-1]|uniref:DUF3341 domain-containing protein n=1 Tax=Plesiocystis pacifica SIR-1 TaxID=391625 RepID=A6GFM2_9BACT|nr:DUF3341 domain-containing protein [Plesiocystis pacifica]EDM75336.1 hypothetical protein PPSIR1_01132 [Plesiocystis pacifica SIR-1]